MADEEYVVEKILSKRVTGYGLEYKVKWEGFPENEATWEPYKNLKHLKELIDEFEKVETIKSKIKQKDKPNSLSNGAEPEFEICDSIENYMTPESVQTVKERGGKLYALVKWLESSDGTLPDDCWVPCDVLSDKYPKILIAFYEAKIKFVKKK